MEQRQIELKKQIDFEVDKFENFVKAVAEKKILWRNTPQEIVELKRDIVMETIAPLLFEYRMLNLTQDILNKKNLGEQ